MKFIRTASRTQQAYLLDNLNTAVVLVDESLAIRYVNAAAEDLFQSSSRQLLDVNLLELMLHPDKHEPLMMAALESNAAYAEGEIVLRRGVSGNTLIATGTVSPMSEPGGANALAIELLPRERHDMIARGESVIMQQHVSRALVRGMAHEIKNPLGGIRGAAQLLERELAGPDQREYTRIIIGEVDRLQTLVNRMLGPLQPPKFSTINVHEILERVRSLVNVEDHGVELIRDYDPSIPDLAVDSDEVLQALLNIVRNAAQALQRMSKLAAAEFSAAEPEGPRPDAVGPGKITLRTRIERLQTIAQKKHRLVARIDIVDNGPGIPVELVQNIFYPMVSGRAEGSGLGLSIAQSMIGRQNGVIECESKPGETIFSILLPLDNQPAKANSDDRSQHNCGAATANVTAHSAAETAANSTTRHPARTAAKWPQFQTTASRASTLQYARQGR